VRRILDFRAQRATAARLTFEAFAADLAEGRDDDAVERTENAVLTHQLKLACSRAMLQCLDGDHRIAFVLGEILELSSPECAEILEIEPAAFRKRLSRARTALAEFLGQQCGVVDQAAPCRCHKRLDRAIALGRIDRDDREVDTDALTRLRQQIASLRELDRVGAYYRDEPAPVSQRDFVARVRALLAGHSSGAGPV
jgi:hypothetical protein